MKTVLKPCSVADAIQYAMNGQQTFILVEITEDTTVGELNNAHGFMTNAPADETEAKPKPKTAPAKPKAAPKAPALDHGKIMALHKAGWGNAKIADEMGCSVQTIINHIQRDLNESQKDPQQGTK